MSGLTQFHVSSSPTGKKFRSKPQLARYLGNAVDLACFDFRTGKMMPGKLQKNKQRFRHDAQNMAKVGGATMGAGPERERGLCTINQRVSCWEATVHCLENLFRIRNLFKVGFI